MGCESVANSPVYVEDSDSSADKQLYRLRRSPRYSRPGKPVRALRAAVHEGETVVQVLLQKKIESLCNSAVPQFGNPLLTNSSPYCPNPRTQLPAVVHSRPGDAHNAAISGDACPGFSLRRTPAAPESRIRHRSRAVAGSGHRR